MTLEALQSINEKINLLHAEADKARKELLSEHEAEVRACKWLKDVTLIFQDGGMDIGCGIAFKLVFSEHNTLLDNVTTGFFVHFPLYGDSKHYQENISLCKEEFWHYLCTDSADTLYKFLDEFKPRIEKSERFDKKLKLFSKIKECMS